HGAELWRHARRHRGDGLRRVQRAAGAAGDAGAGRVAGAGGPARARGPGRRAVRDLGRFLSRRSNLAALALVALFVAVALAAPWLAPRDLGRTEPGGSSRAPVPPDPAHPLGRAPFGLDVYANLIWGTRDALQFGLTVTALTALLGIAVGA